MSEPTDQEKIEKLHAILNHFINEIESVRHERDERIQTIIKKFEEKKVGELLADIKKIKD
ncbi:MAG: hypothetical protein WC752_03305 [Patescibacteria group bacterium]|jgi:hypothetical protein